MAKELSYNLEFEVEFLCAKCNVPLTAAETGACDWLKSITGNQAIRIYPCPSCLNTTVDMILNHKNVKNWKKACKGYKKRNASLRERLAKLAIKYNKLASPKGPRCGAGERNHGRKDHD